MLYLSCVESSVSNAGIDSWAWNVKCLQKKMNRKQNGESSQFDWFYVHVCYGEVPTQCQAWLLEGSKHIHPQS